MAKLCTVQGCDWIISESQTFCARCWNNVPSKDQYAINTAKEALQEARGRYEGFVIAAKSKAASMLRAEL